MRGLTEGLLLLARNEASDQPLKFEVVDLATLLRDVADSLRPLAAEKGLLLCDELPENGMVIRGDSDGLIRLFVNLLTNAIKYTDRGSITLSAAPQMDHWLAVTLRDTGVGIPSEHLPHIFDRFYRIDTSRSTGAAAWGWRSSRILLRPTAVV